MEETEKELIKAGADAAMKPFANLLEKLFGGAVEEIGGMWQDAWKVRRFERQIKLFERLQSKIESSGVPPHPIPDKFWLPSVEAASREDDPTLQDKWASLLANAAITDETFLPAYPEILRQITPIEVQILDGMYQHARRNLKVDVEITNSHPPRLVKPDKWAKVISMNVSLNEVFEAELKELRAEKSRFDALIAFERSIRVSVENLKRLGLVGIYSLEIAQDRMAPGFPFLRFEMLGLCFVHASTTPENRIMG